ncbi:MAG TPA: hypothetical protein VK783_03525 [Bacteroidia bacterium]|jgi:hypothetical protein|nr:hypothetical protein [Bacteroidia bacterium]
MKNQEQQIRSRVKRLIILFIVCLCLSGITAFPLQSEISALNEFFTFHHVAFISGWIEKVYEGIQRTADVYPFMAYGTDWLAFSHLVIAVAFFGPLKDPVRNIWVIQFGRIACIMVFPLAFICGTIRGIPSWWQLIDCSFGITGFILLSVIYISIRRLELITTKN